MPVNNIFTKFGQKVTLTTLPHIGAQERIFLKGSAKIVRKILLHKTMLMILQTINILPLILTIS